MIIDTIDNASRYFSVHPLFRQAFGYIATTSLDTLEAGKYPIEEDKLHASLMHKKGMTEQESTAKFECHNKHIDIQLCLLGPERFGWKPRATCIRENGDYNDAKDVQLYNDRPDMFFQLQAGQFAIFFPEDVHAPLIGGGHIRKLVIKVKI